MTKSAENIEKKIEAQLEKLKQLKAQKQAIEAREKNKNKEQQRTIYVKNRQTCFAGLTIKIIYSNYMLLYFILL